MPELRQEYLDILEKRDWSVSSYTDDGRVELEWWSPAGEDFLVCVNVENFPDEILDYSDDFDPMSLSNGSVLGRHSGTADVIAEMIQNAPAIDPESLRGHAKWVKDKELKFIIVDDENNSHEEPAICCTHCKAKISQSDFDSWVWNFCPVCGFKMEDETEEQHETD